MTASFPDRDRQLIPRWRTSSATLSLGELDPVTTLTPRILSEQDGESLSTRVREWEFCRTAPFAADLVGTALVLGEPAVAREAAEFVLSLSEAPTAARVVAARLLDEGTKGATRKDAERLIGKESHPKSEIRQYRASLRRYPRNPLAWSDLALAYATLGHRKHADRAMRNGLYLAPDDRMLLRSAARLFIHLNESERAHRLLLSSVKTAKDPWLLAAEIATAGAAGRKSPNVRLGRRLVLEQSYSAFHMTELAGAVATMELEAGNDRRARKLFLRSLLDPTENSVAQAEWVSEQNPGFQLEPPLETPNSFEARARRHADQGVWEEAMSDATLWHADQPFAVDPAIFGSWVASVGLQDYEEAARIAQEGLRIKGEDFTLKNNLIFSLLSVGDPARVEEAVQHFKSFRPGGSAEESIVYLATAGLLHFRTGDPDRGRQLYSDAIERARVFGLTRHRAMGALLLAREEWVSQSMQFREAIANAVRLSAGIPGADVALWRSLLTKHVEVVPIHFSSNGRP